VFGRKNDPAKQMRMRKVVVVSYTMMKHLRRSMVSLKWGMLIVDESHNLRCTQKKLPCEEVSLHIHQTLELLNQEMVSLLVWC
jgi:hypothetical protein